MLNSKLGRCQKTSIILLKLNIRYQPKKLKKPYKSECNIDFDLYHLVISFPPAVLTLSPVSQPNFTVSVPTVLPKYILLLFTFKGLRQAKAIHLLFKGLPSRLLYRIINTFLVLFDYT